MNNTFYFLRHGKTQVDPNTPVSKWVLSEMGEIEAQRLADEGTFKDIDIIFSSTETKAYQTAKPTAEKIGQKITEIEELSELDRDKGEFLTSERFDETVKDCLDNPDHSINNWETASHALERFSKKIEELDQEYQDKKILIVGHGLTINMYFAKLLNCLDQVNERLKRNTFADWGVVENGKVIKDIAKTPLI